MRLTGYEIKKLMTQIPLWIAFIGLFVGNLFLLFIDAIEGARAERKDKPKHEDFMDAMLRGLFGGSVGHIEITGKRNGKTDEEIAEIVDKTIKDIISGMAGVELEEIKEGNGYTEVHITGNANPIEVREYIEKELKDRLAMVL